MRVLMRTHTRYVVLSLRYMRLTAILTAQQSQLVGIKKFVEELRELFEQHWRDMESTPLRKSGDYNLQYGRVRRDVASCSHGEQ